MEMLDEGLGRRQDDVAWAKEERETVDPISAASRHGSRGAVRLQNPLAGPLQHGPDDRQRAGAC